MDMMDLNLSLIRIRHARRQRRDGVEICENAYKYDKKIDIARISDIIGDERADRYADILRRYRADDENWVTIKGTHVLIDENGVALSGGKLKGMTFANAKSVKSKSAKKGEGEKGGKAGVKSPAKKDPAVLRKTATDAAQKCVDIKRDIRYAKKLAGMTPDQLDLEKTNAQAQVAKLKKSAKSADTKAKKAEKEAGEALGGMTRDELDQAIEKKRKEKHDAYKRYLMPRDKEEEEKAKEEWYRMNSEHLELVDKAAKDDNAKKLRDKADAKAAELEEAERYVDAIGRRQSGELGNYPELREAHKKAAEERDKAVLEAFSSASECETSQQATDYLRAKGYFRKSVLTGDESVDITKMKPEHAVANAAQVERFMEDYPFLKGNMDGIDCHNFEEDSKSEHKNYSNVLGYAHGTRICFPEGYYGKHTNISKDAYKGDIKKSYEDCVKQNYHPPGTDYTSVIDHELTHAAVKVVQAAAKAKGMTFSDGRLENEVMRRVQMKLYGTYSKAKESDVRKMVSDYAADNRGVTLTSHGAVEHIGYGRNTEFLAEAMAEARCSKTPREVSRAAREAFEEIMKEAGLI